MRHAWATRSTKVRRAVALALLAGVAAAGGAITVSAQGMGGGMGGGMMGGLGGGGGMMGGSGGYGSGSRMMGGQPFGGYGYGANPSTAPAYRDGEYDQLHLSDPQRAKIEAIQEQSARERSALEATMRSEQERLDEFYASGRTDDASARRTYQSLSETRRKLFEASLDTRKRIDAVLTKEQREQLARARADDRPPPGYGDYPLGAR